MVSVGSQCNISNYGCDGSSDCIPAASYYALKLAFQTLKERCDKLQQKFQLVEGENLKLKGNSLGRVGGNEERSVIIETLEKKIEQLSKRELQLSHHFFLLVNENKDLCNRLSLATEEKQILSDQVRDLTTKLDSVRVKEREDDGCNFVPGDTEGFLECPLKSDSERERKESLESIETVKDLSLQDEPIIHLLEVHNELKNILEKLQEDRSYLQQQQAGMKVAFETVQKIYRGMKMYKKYLQHLKIGSEFFAKDQDKKNSPEITSSAQEFEEVGCPDESICPFCNKLFLKSTTSEEYCKHFLHHFQDCSDNDNDNLNSFEVIEAILCHQ